jgi:HK97 gp10 family phage protein
MSGFTVTGLKELAESFKQFGVKGQLALEKGLFQASSQLATEIQMSAPVGSIVHAPKGNKKLGVSILAKARYPGNLKKSIVVQRVKTGDVTGQEFSYRVGPNKGGFYGYFLEFGTKRMRARPFVRPAFDRSQAALLDTVANAVKAELEK